MTRRLVALFVLCCLVPSPAPAAPAAAHSRTPRERLAELPVEHLEDPPGIPAAASLAPARLSPASVITYGRFTHVQVNVNGAGANIVGDAANEPSITVDPTNHDRMAIGWRQFDTVLSNFRQAGYGWTTNGGLTWTTGKIEPGVFRSDPVLGADASGRFFYNSLTQSDLITTQLFPSVDHGATWGSSVFAYGGDKQWMTIDRTNSPGRNRIYQAWSTASDAYAPYTFNRSLDDGASFEYPSYGSATLVWGTLDVTSDGTVYVVGTDGPGGSIYVGRSTDARGATATPTFTVTTVDATHGVWYGDPNPSGLCGQLWIAVDRSGGPRDGWVYVLASVTNGADPLDVMFWRSTDHGATWSAPLRVNDDPVSSHAWQWFGTMSVAPGGRIDAVWNDSRVSGDSTMTALFYTCSYDGGFTWQPNEQASPAWSCSVGYPNQAKIGDYYQTVSDNTGADLAWSATFNGGEDVYYCRIAAPLLAVEQANAPRTGLRAVVPNPFAGSTHVHFDVPAGGARVRLAVFDPAGRRVATLADGFRAGGEQVASWDGRDEAGRAASPGLYLCRYEAGGVAQTGKLLLVR